jgi:peroxiredoxin
MHQEIAMVRLTSIFLAAACVFPAVAGEFNRKLSVGDAAPAWSDLPGIDGKKHALADLKDKDVVVVVFTCNQCPVANDYEERIVAFAKKYAKPDSKLAIVGINTCVGEDEDLAKMAEHAKKAGFTFTYVADVTQKLGRAYGASVTPEFFVLNKERKVVYMGAMDDHINPAKVKKTYLDKAVETILKGDKPAKAETAAQGCAIEYKAGK